MIENLKELDKLVSEGGGMVKLMMGQSMLTHCAQVITDSQHTHRVYAHCLKSSPPHCMTPHIRILTPVCSGWPGMHLQQIKQMKIEARSEGAGPASGLNVKVGPEGV